ncbi:MAG: HAMP domain-containing protein [Planctomycetes bacterium]|nr:HAMP domain-containing protein [Planctomycetota bacterium]
MAAAEPPRGGLRLSSMLVLALLTSAAALAAVLLLFVAPRTATTLGDQGRELRERNFAAMHELAHQQTQTTSKVLVDLIDQGTRARRRTLRDLPLEALGGDVAAIRREIEREDSERGARQQRNVEVLAAEMQRRAERDITARFAALQTEQQRLVDAATAQLRTTHITLVAAALLFSLVVLWFGLSRLVVRPTRALRRATQRVAAGDLDAEVPPPTGGEIGDLTRDFAQMQAELQKSRAALQGLNSTLEQEVARKTEHLQQALAELQSSHRQLAATERLAALGTLAGGIAHEFQNVIGGMRGCTEELLVEERDEERRETMQVILRAAERASGIVQQLLRFARRSIDSRADLDPALVVEDALRLCEPGARRQGVQVQRDLTPGLLVHGDSGGLHQVVVNLLLNALQAMPSGGELRIAVRARGEEVEIVVADTGSGIAAEHLPHVFEPFFTTRGQDAGKPGTGLGLSVTYGIVAAHHGRIDVASTVGAGTTFTVTLPAATPT